MIFQSDLNTQIESGKIIEMRKPPLKHTDLLEKKVWSVQDLFWLLLGDFGFENTLSIVQGDHQKHVEIEGRVEEAADQGRFGMLLNTDATDDPVGVPFSWGVSQCAFEEKSAEDNYQRDIKLLDYLPTFQIHPMRIIDWIESEDIFEFIDKNRAKELKGLIKDFRASRSKDLIPSRHAIDWVAFSKASFWVKTELRVLLFGQTKACSYPSKEYWRFNLDEEIIKEEIDQYIEDAKALKGVHKFSTENKNWKPLIPHKEYDEINDDFPYEYYNYAGFYDRKDISFKASLHSPTELLKLLSSKGYPVQDELVEAFKNGRPPKLLIPFLQELNQRILSFVTTNQTDSNSSYESILSPSIKFPSGIKSGRSTLPAKQGVMQEALKILRDKGQLSAAAIAKEPRIMAILAKGVKVLSSDILTDEDFKQEYKKNFGASLRTVEGWIREAFKQNKPS